VSVNVDNFGQLRTRNIFILTCSNRRTSAILRGVELSNILANELGRRRTHNQNYSLRAFARDLEIDPSYLSKLIQGKRIASEPMYQKIITKISAIKELTAAL